jgi:hypothetical protein
MVLLEKLKHTNLDIFGKLRKGLHPQLCNNSLLCRVQQLRFCVGYEKVSMTTNDNGRILVQVMFWFLHSHGD